MSGDGSADMAANAWPGFVDILSAVVIMFVFFVLIISAVLYFYTLTYKARVEGAVVEPTDIVQSQSLSTNEDIEKLQKENQELREKVELAAAKYDTASGESETESTTSNEAPQSFGSQASEQAVLASDGGQSLVLFHDPGAITVDDLSEEKIAAFLENASARYGSQNIELVITSPKNADATTQTREKRLAVARMLNVRNALLKSSLDRKNINLTVVESEAIEGSNDWTRLSVNVLE